MKIIDTIKWLWDPRTEKQKAYEEWDRKTPLQRRTQELHVFIRGEVDEPFVVEYMAKDWVLGTGEAVRWASNTDSFTDELIRWISRCGTQGIIVDGVWYSPAMIERIEMGESRLEAIDGRTEGDFAEEAQ